MHPIPSPGRRCHGRTRRHPAFTLVELLVVIGIVALLTSLLLPALARSKDRTRSVACLGNLRQMAIAAEAYTLAHDDAYPIAYYTLVQDGVTVAQAWDLTTRFENPPRVVPGLLWEGEGTEQVQQCPSFRGPANWLDDPVTGYNYNTSYLGRGQFESIPSPARAAWVKQPAGTVVFGDGQYAGGANKFMRAPWPSPGDAGFRGRWSGTQGFRHTGRSNASFADGHAASLQRRHTDNADGTDRVAPGTGFLSPDNSLYDWE
ncbi:MAG: prepilin-type N-terminal cleavage/methylation domain-containing protein [Verrucomicrobiae bacterium]|nr:prepilin-type N-terminal cleavage/methylation domain-containing protein [Verrucomicrobiae bacterium]